ncbi:copper(I) chaperone CopZ [Bacillus sp. JCM 19046]|uniref:Copper chaperone CopZ n=1 Tax=Shouchella xiaoxiensis TaxID=766895 RepID=A0ABS2SYE8_9BACI|nr:copper chaperone [Shouchella xiaoxiensis]GAF14682.1 copper(I) chaperone CopZ [Bacillus sp. JCM 19045]GAF16552.1 copper(I) chaperone CopZ [Bacillus sp. JCM 19046]
MEQATIAVTGMSCGHCVASIEKALTNLSGVDQVSVSLEKSEVDVSYNQELITINEIKEEIEDQGYDAKD